MTERVWIAGVGMTPFAVHPDLTGHDLARWAVREALADAGDAAVEDIEIAFYGNITDGALQGQHTIPGQIALRGMQLQTVPVHNVENACATGSTALNLAAMAIRAGEADIALAVGAEKMNIGDRARSMALFDSGYDVSNPDALIKALEELGVPSTTRMSGHGPSSWTSTRPGPATTCGSTAPPSSSWRR